jgi:hypothetical protein
VIGTDKCPYAGLFVVWHWVRFVAVLLLVAVPRSSVGPVVGCALQWPSRGPFQLIGIWWRRRWK